VFCYRAKKYIGAYLAALGGAEAILFSGGIGENSPEIRKRICEGMNWCSLSLDAARNMDAVSLAGPTRISADQARIAVFAMPADEETWIARETVAVIATLPGGSRP
jgi:acetate kinase